MARSAFPPGLECFPPLETCPVFVIVDACSFQFLRRHTELSTPPPFITSPKASPFQARDPTLMVHFTNFGQTFFLSVENFVFSELPSLFLAQFTLPPALTLRRVRSAPFFARAAHFEVFGNPNF